MSASESPCGDPLLPDRGSPSASSGFVSAILEEGHRDGHWLQEGHMGAETNLSIADVCNSEKASRTYRVEALIPSASMESVGRIEQVASAPPEPLGEDAAVATFTNLLPADPREDVKRVEESVAEKPMSRATKTYAMLLEEFLESSKERRASPQAKEQGRWVRPEDDEKNAMSLVVPERSEDLHFPVEPLYFRGDNVSDLLGLLAADVRKATCVNESFVEPPAPTEAETQQLRFSARFDMPRRFRCNFCRKYDSICSHCHIKWTQLQTNHRRFLVAEIYGKLSARTRCSVSFLTAMCGNASFSKMQSFHDRGEFAATKVDFAEKVPRLLTLFSHAPSCLPFVERLLPKMGGVTQLHVGIGFENPTLIEYWFSPGFAAELAWRNSTLDYDPLEAAQGRPLSPVVLAALDRSAEVQKHLLFARGRQLLCVGDPESVNRAELYFADLMVLDDEDPRGLYGKAVLRFTQERYKECVDLITLGVERCGKRAQECENFSLQVRFGELLTKARSSLAPPALQTPPPPTTQGVRLERAPVFLLCTALATVTPFCGPLALTALDHTLSLSLRSHATKRNERKDVALLLHTRLLAALKSLPAETLTAHLKSRPLYDRLAEEVVRRGPTEFLTPPLQLLNIRVVEVEDMYAFHVKVYLIGMVNRRGSDTEKVLQSKGIARDVSEVVVTKHFFICRAREQDVWLVSDIKKEKHSKGSEKKDTHKWHLDLGLTTSLGSYVKKNIERIA